MLLFVLAKTLFQDRRHVEKSETTSVVTYIYTPAFVIFSSMVNDEINFSSCDSVLSGKKKQQDLWK